MPDTMTAAQSRKRPSKRRGIFSPLVLILSLALAAMVCVVAVAAYLALGRLALAQGFGHLQLAVLLWLGIGWLAGVVVARLARGVGLKHWFWGLVLALATAWMLFVFHWAGWTWLRDEPLPVMAEILALGDHLVRYATLPAQDWAGTVAEWDRDTGITFGGSIGALFTTTQIYWLETGLMALFGALAVLRRSGR